MKKSNKAALLSTTVFPGAGYFMLAKPKRGLIALAVALISLFFIMREAMFKADIIANQILQGEMVFDPILITQQLVSEPSLYSPAFIENLTLFIVGTWLVTALDCYRIGRQLDNKLSFQQ